MPRVFLLLLGILGAAGPGLAQPLERLLQPETLHPWAAVGRLNVQGAGFCTAIVALAEPVDIAPSRPIPPAAGVPSGQSVTVLSYGEGRAEVPSLQAGCAAGVPRLGILPVTCAADPGTSGAPILINGPDGPEIVAVISAVPKHRPGARDL